MKPVYLNLKYGMILIICSSLLIVSSCEMSSDPVSPTESLRGKLIETEFTDSLTSDLISAMFSFAGDIPEFIPQYDVTIYRVVYNTLDPDGNIVQASGAIFIPSLAENLPLASIQHGTQSLREGVASVNPFNGFEGIISASLGYYTVMPDYLGLGISEMIHPYHHAKTSADCVIDIIKAAQIFAPEHGVNLSGKIFLVGYSEGGYVTLATQKEIDLNYHNEITLTAVSAMAGAYDLVTSSTDVISDNTYNMPGYIAFLVTAYNEIYHWNRLGEIFKEPYAAKMLRLYDGTKTISQINRELTTNISDLFKDEFRNGVLNGTETNLINAFVQNSLIDWTPITPLLLVHGTADEYVPYENSTSAIEAFTNRGATNVQLISIEGGTHATSVIPAIIATMNWFEQF